MIVMLIEPLPPAPMHPNQNEDFNIKYMVGTVFEVGVRPSRPNEWVISGKSSELNSFRIFDNEKKCFTVIEP